jgi:CHAT domain-containing protein
LPSLGRHVLSHVARHLRRHQATGVVLIPTGRLSILPLHSAPYQEQDHDLCLLDEFDVAYATSARVLSVAQRELEARQSQNLFPYLVGIGNPLPDQATGQWAQDQLLHILPPLQQYVQEFMRNISIQQSRQLSDKDPQIEPLSKFVEASLKRLQILSQESPETLVHAGSYLLQASQVFSRVPDLPSEYSATLSSIVERIPTSLKYAKAELESVQCWLPEGVSEVLYEHQATRDAFWAKLPQATIAHCACHGQFDATLPLNSALLLAEGSSLTLRDLLNAEAKHLTHLQLAVLSACQTATIDIRRTPDEVIGLFSGFLQAGVPSVIGTLWSVDDISTALLILRFYELHLQGDRQAGLPPQHPAQALRIAQRWMRTLSNEALYVYLQTLAQPDAYPANWHLAPLLAALLPKVRRAIRLGQKQSRPYSKPYYWAAFVYYGVLEQDNS